MIRIADLKTNAKSSDELLKDYLTYETNFYKEHLKDISSSLLKSKNGRSRMTWSATPTAPSSKVRNVYLAFTHKKYIISLGTVIKQGEGEELARKYLESIASSFKPSEQPIKLQFEKDGSYTHASGS